MTQDLLQIRKLTNSDYDIVRQMQTNIKDDYILQIFPELVDSETHSLFGLFEQGNLLAIAGYTIFPGGYAMLGRLRSDHRYLSKGNASNILTWIKNELKQIPEIKWIGANTNINNKAARRVLEKIGFSEVTKLHSHAVHNQQLLKGADGYVWNVVTSMEEKRILLNTVNKDGLGGVYPYEIYYPFPYTPTLITDDHLHKLTFYQNSNKDRFMVIMNDHKHEQFAQVKYFWNDHFKQPGFWSTVFHYVEKQIEDIKIWLDFSEKGYANIPDKTAFEDADGWVLYGEWLV